MTPLLPATALPDLCVPGALVRHPMDKAPHRVLDDGTVAPPWNGRTGDPPSPFVVLDLRDRVSRSIAATALAVALGMPEPYTGTSWWWAEVGTGWVLESRNLRGSCTWRWFHDRVVTSKGSSIYVPGLPAGPENAAEALAACCVAVGKAGR